MSVYKNDRAGIVRDALISIIDKQTVPPTEVILVEDGQVNDTLEQMLVEYAATHPSLRIIRNATNRGLGVVLEQAVSEAKYDIVARMDSDDLSMPDRFEKQLSYLAEHPEVDIVGGQISEFIDSPNSVIGYRLVPLEHEAICRYLKSRCPLNHVTVMFRKDAVIKAGNYQAWFNNEDYYLWIRMFMNGCRFANMPDVLVNVHVGHEMYSRRGGRNYFHSERLIQRFMLKNHIISYPRYCYNVLGRFVMQIVLTNSARSWLYKSVFRSQK